MNDLPAKADYGSLIERAAMDPDFDVHKLQALLDMKEAEENRAAEKAFNIALVKAQGAMTTIIADRNNPQTKSRYASYAELDRSIRPHYVAQGLAPSFGTEPLNEPDKIRVIGMLAHIGGFVRRYQIDIPVDTKGLRGINMMTPTHATGSALTYGKRYLLVAMFNLSIADKGMDDDDGNNAWRRRPQNLPVIQRPPAKDEPIDPDTGEVFERPKPQVIESNMMNEFIRQMIAYYNGSESQNEADEWISLNQDKLLRIREAKPDLYRNFEKAIEAHKLALYAASQPAGG
jgi:hypothetical protein